MIMGLALILARDIARAGQSTSIECQKLLVRQDLTSLNDQTSQLIAYLGNLIDRKVIGDSQLSSLIEHLDKGEVANLIDEQDANERADLFIHREGIQKLLGKSTFDLGELKSWAEQKITDKSLIHNKRNKVKEEIKTPFIPMTFHSVEALSIEVMSTPFTQKMWVDLFRANPAGGKNGDLSIVEKISGYEVKMQPDNPVELVTWWSVVVAANKLSEEHGYPPVYDLSDIKWNSGSRVEDGSLLPLSGKTGKVKINAPGGDIYRATGYRLPTAAEQEKLLKLEEEQNGARAYSDRAWFLENSDSVTHPVAEKLPLLIDGKPIYDLRGNVSEWASDWSDGESNTQRTYRGGGVQSSKTELESDSRRSFNPNYSSSSIGFRLVRAK